MIRVACSFSIDLFSHVRGRVLTTFPHSAFRETRACNVRAIRLKSYKIKNDKKSKREMEENPQM